jgi:hypothetical protein
MSTRVITPREIQRAKIWEAAGFAKREARLWIGACRSLQGSHAERTMPGSAASITRDNVRQARTSWHRYLRLAAEARRV